jgi:hypothetical protein
MRIGGLGLLLASAAWGAETELLRDPSFQNGFILLKPEPGQIVKAGVVRGNQGDAAFWQLAQWSSAHAFDAATPVEPQPDNSIRLANTARTLVFGGPDGTLALAVNTGEEYDGKGRAKGRPWVHMLVQQKIEARPCLGDLKTLRLQFEARRIRCKALSRPQQDPNSQAAQFLLFLTIQNQEKDSPGFGDFLWFGVPIFDNRYRTSNTYAAKDFAGSGKFIFTPGSPNYTSGSLHNPGWVMFRAELLPLIREGLATAQRQGFLKNSSEKHFRVAGINMGWEVPGVFDVEVHVRKLHLTAEP